MVPPDSFPTSRPLWRCWRQFADLDMRPRRTSFYLLTQLLQRVPMTLIVLTRLNIKTRTESYEHPTLSGQWQDWTAFADDVMFLTSCGTLLKEREDIQHQSPLVLEITFALAHYSYLHRLLAGTRWIIRTSNVNVSLSRTSSLCLFCFISVFTDSESLSWETQIYSVSF